jgi:hypothetical protein
MQQEPNKRRLIPQGRARSDRRWHRPRNLADRGDLTLAREAETVDLTDAQAYQLTALASGAHIQAEQLLEWPGELRRRVEDVTLINRNYWTEGSPEHG